jgi:hypothetical protein
MKSTSLGYREQIRRHFGAALAITALFAVCGGAAAQNYVNVWVVQTTTTAPKCSSVQQGYIVCVDQDPITTTPYGSNDVRITWNLDGDTGWTFDRNKGIDIKNKKNWVPKYVSPTQYNAKNKKENGSQSYKYEINLENGSTKLSWDPTIMN